MAAAMTRDDAAAPSRRPRGGAPRGGFRPGPVRPAPTTSAWQQQQRQRQQQLQQQPGHDAASDEVDDLDGAATLAQQQPDVVAHRLWARKLLRKTFAALHRSAKLAKVQQRSRKMQALRFWAIALQCKALAGWREACREAKARHAKTLRAYRFWAHRAARKVLLGLRANVRMTRLQRFKAERLRIRREAAERQRALSAAWATWSSSALRKRHKADDFARDRLLWTALTAWRRLPRDSVQEREADRLARAAIHARRRQLRFAFDSLRALSRERRRDRENAIACIWFRWHVLVGGALRLWVKRTEASLIGVRKARAFRATRDRRRLDTVFSAWVLAVREREAKRMRSAIALRHWARASTARAFHGWLLVLASKCKTRGHEVRANLALERLRKARTLRRLAAHGARCKHSASLAAQSQAFWRRRAWARGFARLRDHALRARAAARLRDRAASHFAGTSSRRAWAALVAFRDAEVQRMRDVGVRADALWRETIAPRIVRDTWQRWAEFRLQRQLDRVRAARADRARAEFAQRAALRQLGYFATTRRTRRLLEARASAHLRQTDLGRAWRGWHAHHMEFVRAAQQAAVALRHWRLTLLRSAWRFWMDLHRAKQHERAMAEFASTWRRDYLLREGVSLWLGATTQERAARAAALQTREARLAASRADRVARIAFHWRDLTLRRRLARDRQNGVAGSRSSRSSSSSSSSSSVFPGRRRPVPRPVVHEFNPDVSVAPRWSYEARTQVQASLSLDWLDALVRDPGVRRNPGRHAAGRARPAPRRPLEALLLDASAVSTRSENDEGSSLLPVDEVDVDVDVDAPARGTCRPPGAWPARLASEVQAYLDLRRQVRADKRRREAIRADLLRRQRGGDGGEGAATADLLEEIVAMQARRADLRRRRADLLPELRGTLRGAPAG